MTPTGSDAVEIYLKSVEANCVMPCSVYFTLAAGC